MNRYLLLALCTFGCVTPKATTLTANRDFELVCNEDSRMASIAHSLVTCTFANRTTTVRDLEFERVTPADSEARVASVQDIEQTKLIGDDSSRRVALGLLFVGIGAAASQNAGSTGGVGLTGAIASLPNGKSSGNTLDAAASTNQLSSAPNPLSYAPNHILGPSVRVDQGSTATRSVLFLLGKDHQAPRSMELCFKQPSAECLTLTINLWEGRSRTRPVVTGS